MSPLVLGLLIFIAIDFLVVLYVFWKRNRRKNSFTIKELNYIRSHWIRIIDSFPGNPKASILDADKLLDYSLKKKGYEGSLGEKLKKAKGHFSRINDVWSAHKLRNRVAHELGEIDVRAAKLALAQFKRALNDLGAKL